ncbi:hypothetical protein [Francisella sp. SYW-9]|uniref:hypothetical protein n=1 Tax=Francisella sp. SYW-9 TaxID=2610888 RepID=UPI00123E2580|nr:hypothetical protein [Francisella sp. SYW-9]
MFDNLKVNELKRNYDEILTKRVWQYIEEKGFTNISVAKASNKAKSYRVMVTLKDTIYLTNLSNESQRDRSDTCVSKIKYAISEEALLKADFSNIDSQGIARTKVLISILTRSYIKQIIKLISEIREEVGKSSILVNKLSRVLLDIVTKFYTFSMELSTEDTHEKYKQILENSNNYIELASSQMSRLEDACEIIGQTSQALDSGKVSEESVELLNGYVKEAIEQLNQTILRIKEYIVADVADNIQNLKAKFVMFSKYAVPLQYSYQCKAIIDSGDSSAIFHKEMAQLIFRETIEIYITELLPNYEVHILSSHNNDWFTRLQQSLKARLASQNLFVDDIKKNILAKEELSDVSLPDLDSSYDSLEKELDPFVDRHLKNVDEAFNQKKGFKGDPKKHYIQSLIKFIEANYEKTIAEYSSDKIESEFFGDKVSDDFHNKILFFNLINFICGISTKLSAVYGQGKITDNNHIRFISQQLHITTNFSQDIINTFDEPMTKAQFREYSEALSNEIKRFNNYKNSVLSSLERYQSLPDNIEQIGDVLKNIDNQLGGSRDAVIKLKENITDIKSAVHQQLKIVKKQAELLSSTLENIKSTTEDIKDIETAKIERLRTFSPNLQDAENRAQYYILNALAETQSETAQNVSRDISGLRNRALNFVKMTAVMNFIVKQGLIGKTSLELTMVSKDNTKKLFTYNEFNKLKLEENIFTVDNKSIADDFPGLFQYCYLGALREAYNRVNGEIKLKDDKGTKEYEFHTVFPTDSNYIDFMISYYYIQIIFPFLSKDQAEFEIYMQILALMESIFISWISNIQEMLSKKEHFKMMKEAYINAMDNAMRDMHRDHLKSQENMTIFQSMSRGSKRAISWVGELFVKDSSMAKIGKTFKNYNVQAKHIDDFYKIFATKYKDEIGNATTVNLPMVLLVASDLSIKAVKDREVDMIKVLFAGAITGGVAGLIGISKFKSVLAGLTASTVYGLGSWVCNTFSNYPNNALRVEHLREANENAKDNDKSSKL